MAGPKTQPRAQACNFCLDNRHKQRANWQIHGVFSFEGSGMRAVGSGLHNSFLKQIICNFLSVESCNEVLIQFRKQG